MSLYKYTSIKFYSGLNGLVIANIVVCGISVDREIAGTVSCTKASQITYRNENGC